MGREGLDNGADFFVRRPAELASDEASASDTWRHAWNAAEAEFGERFEISVLLQPSSPTRTVHDVESTIQRIADEKAIASLTVSSVPKHYSPYKMLTMTSDGSLSSFVSGVSPNARRQTLPVTYWLNGHCYGVRRDEFLQSGVIIPEGTAAVVVDRDVANIDEYADLEWARWLIARQE